MKQGILKNNLKVIYEHRKGELSSICISFNAGAGAEKEDEKTQSDVSLDAAN